MDHNTKLLVKECEEYKLRITTLTAELEQVKKESSFHLKRRLELEDACKSIDSLTAELKSWRWVAGRLEAENQRLREGYKDIQAMIDKQAEDEGLWFIAQTAPEAYLQQELRKLHGLCEDRLRALLDKEDDNG